MTHTGNLSIKDRPLVSVPQVGSNDLTLVNLHLATLTLPGGENPSKNHSDSHRVASFAQTLQETLKGRTVSFSVGWAVGRGSPLPSVSLIPSARRLSAAVQIEDTGDHHTPASPEAWPPLCVVTSLSLWASHMGSTSFVALQPLFDGKDRGLGVVTPFPMTVHSG